MAKCTLGIDPGLSGALCFYSGDSLKVYDMPTTSYLTKSKKKRSEVNVPALLAMLAQHKIDDCWLEKVQGMPGQGGGAMFNFGQSYGMLRACLTASQIKYNLVTPQAWKKSYKLKKDKGSAMSLASQLLPKFADNWPLKGHDGRAEAALIALYGFKSDAQGNGC